MQKKPLSQGGTTPEFARVLGRGLSGDSRWKPAHQAPGRADPVARRVLRLARNGRPTARDPQPLGCMSSPERLAASLDGA